MKQGMSTNLVQEQLSLAYVQAVIFRAGFNLSELRVDDHGIDGTIKSYSTGINRVDFQLKSTVNYELKDEHVVYDLNADNYNVLVAADGIPAILILFVMPEDCDRWLEQSEDELRLRHCAYWLSLEGQQRTTAVSTKRVSVPRTNTFTATGLNQMFSQLITGWPKY